MENTKKILKILFYLLFCAILVVLNFLTVNYYRGFARDAKRLADMSAVAASLQMYYTDNGTYNLGKNCLRGSFLEDAVCATPLVTYLKVTSVFTDPALEKVLCTTDVCGNKNCAYTVGDNFDEQSFKIYFHLEKGLEGLAAGCHYLDQNGIH